MKKVCLFILSLLCLFALTACSSCAKTVNDENVSLVDKDITVYVGETYQFTPSGAESFSYTSSNESVAKVSEDGTLVGMSDGTAFVVVATDTDSVTCRVNVLKTENYIRLNYESFSAVCGSKISLKAEVIKNGEVTSDIVDFSYTESDIFSAEKSANELSLTLNKIGNFSVEVKSGSLEKTCKIKSVNATAAILSEPSLSVENCKTVKWEAVAGADSYMYSINGGDWQETKETSFDVTEITDEMLFTDKAVFAVKAVSGDEDYDHIDGKFTTIDFSHDYVETVTEEHTCVKSGVSDFECEICHKKYTDSARIDDHDYIDGACTVCGEQQTKQIIYRYDEYNDCYYVVGTDAGFAYEDVYILAKYDDGTHGEKSVKYIGYKAFASNTTIKKVVLPESMTEFVDQNPNFKDTNDNSLNNMDKNGEKVSSPLKGCCFDGCTSLEYVSMKGITMLRDVAQEKYTLYSHWNFRDCYNLKQIIVGDGFNNYGATFMRWNNTESDAENQTDIYAVGTVKGLCSSSYPIGVDVGYGNNTLLTGDIFYYSTADTLNCFEWHYAEDGETIVSGGKHVFTASGKCKKCGALDSNGIRYGYYEGQDIDGNNIQTYYVSDNSNVLMSEIEILAEYNDGVHGTHAVTFVKNGAFSGNENLVKITLPETITRLDGGVFMACPKLEYVSMLGITDMAFKNISNRTIYGDGVDTGNNFLDCYNLKTLFVNKDFDLYADGDAQQFLGRGDNVTPYIDIYSNGTVEESNINANPSGKNNLLTGNIYYYDNSGALATCLRWTEIDEMTATSSTHNYVNDKCSVCGIYNLHGVVYGFDSTSNSYYVAGYGGTESTVNILSSYDDGTNGEHNVTFVKACAFISNTTIKKVILPETITRLDGSVFVNCTNLEYISMLGVKQLSTVTRATLSCFANVYNNENDFTNHNFMNCGKLTTVIVNKEFTCSDAQFMLWGETFEACVNIYVCGEESESNITIGTANNELLTGNVYYYDKTGALDTCLRWTEADGVITTSFTHNYVNDKCSVCGIYNLHGIVYGFDSTSNSYYVAGYSGSESTVNILSSYDDGTNGKHDVTFVKASAFNSNATIKKVILPETITRLDGSVFVNCTNLEYISMLGVKQLSTVTRAELSCFANVYNNENDYTNHNFMNCGKLTTVIVNKEFTCSDAQFMLWGETFEACVNIYVCGEESESNITIGTANNELLTGTKYYYSDTKPTDTTKTCWHYVDDVATIWEVE